MPWSRIGHCKKFFLAKDLHLNDYNIQLAQELKPAQRREFVVFIMEQQKIDDDFQKKKKEEYYLQGKSHFHLMALPIDKIVAFAVQKIHK